MSETRERNIQKWKQLIQQRLYVGTPIRQFCEENGCSEKSYYYWASVIRKSDPEFETGITKRLTPANAPAAFVELKPENPESEATVVVQDDEDHRLITPEKVPAQKGNRSPVAVIRIDSMEISLYPNASASFLEGLLKAVRHA